MYAHLLVMSVRARPLARIYKKHGFDSFEEMRTVLCAYENNTKSFDVSLAV